jgi:hypothetical protein
MLFKSTLTRPFSLPTHLSPISNLLNREIVTTIPTIGELEMIPPRTRGRTDGKRRNLFAVSSFLFSFSTFDLLLVFLSHVLLPLLL